MNSCAKHRGFWMQPIPIRIVPLLPQPPVLVVPPPTLQKSPAAQSPFCVHTPPPVLQAPAVSCTTAFGAPLLTTRARVPSTICPSLMSATASLTAVKLVRMAVISAAVGVHPAPAAVFMFTVRLTMLKPKHSFDAHSESALHLTPALAPPMHFRVMMFAPLVGVRFSSCAGEFAVAQI